MPPKQKYSKQAIIDAAFEIYRRESNSAINARQIAKELRCSTQPVFSCFSSMDELKEELFEHAKGLYREYIKCGLSSENAFKGAGLAYIAFARQEPQLFKKLFMQEGHINISNALDVEESNKEILLSLMSSTGLSRQAAYKLYTEIWIFTYGIASMLATRTFDFTDEQIERMLDDAFIGLITRIRQTESEQ
ncbi:MAG: WHG domain-containing protein [Candidatus Metalachnospira sp.]|nr:WHG domain-containing protein [Candidatus Metalachnospira sp.]